MNIKGLNIGFALTGSFCTIEEILFEIDKLVEKGANIIPIVSSSTKSIDNRFTTPKVLLSTLETMTKNPVISTIQAAEPIGPKNLLDILVVAPCTGNTLSKITHGITDTPVTMAVKAHLRNDKPIVISISSNDALAANGRNIGDLLNRKNIFFVPFYQDDPDKKSRSLVGKSNLIYDTILKALENKQIQPILAKS